VRSSGKRGASLKEDYVTAILEHSASFSVCDKSESSLREFKPARIDDAYGATSSSPLPLKRKAESDESPSNEFKRTKIVEEVWRNVSQLHIFLLDSVELSRRLFLKNLV
jgi:hypothetical protein